jgi:hypothetical protein
MLTQCITVLQVEALLQKKRPTTTASAGDLKDVPVEIYVHRTIKAGILRDTPPNVTLQVGTVLPIKTTTSCSISQRGLIPTTC